jgi:hypothetical protein
MLRILSAFLLPVALLTMISCEEEVITPPPPSTKTDMVIEGVTYQIDTFEIEDLSNARMIYMRTFLTADRSTWVGFYADLSYTGSGEIPVGTYTFTGPLGIKRSAVRTVDQNWVNLYSTSPLIDIITSASLVVSEASGKNVRVKGYINYDSGSGMKKVEIDYEGKYTFYH